MPAKMRRTCLIAVCAGLLAACAPRFPSQAVTEHAPADFPESSYRQAETLGRNILRVDPQRSLVVIEVGRAGPLARMGHDHVVASRHVRGYVDPEGGRADLYIPLDSLVVDESALRAEAGMATQPDQEAIEGTRRNMLTKVLDAERFPFALVHATRADADRSALKVLITLHGVTRTMEIPARLENVPGGMVVAGRLAFNQTDFGIVPFSVLGGALQVRDRLELRFRIFAGG